MQGSPGTGKTTWLASLLRQVLSAEEPFGIVDCKADLFAEAVRSTAAIARRLPGDRGAALGNRLIVINPFAERLAPLNVCAPLAGIGAEAQAYEITLALSRPRFAFPWVTIEFPASTSSAAAKIVPRSPFG